MKAVIDIVF